MHQNFLTFVRRSFFALAVTAVAISSGGSARGDVVTIDFSAFPGPDNVLGTADDVPINAGSGNGSAVFFTNEFSRLAGGVGLVVDSAVGGNSSLGYLNGLGAVVRNGTDNVLVTARPDVGTGQFSFAALRWRFVSSADASAPAAVQSVSFNFVPNIAPGFTDTARFYSSSGTLLATRTYTDGVGSSLISYSNAAGIGRVDIDTNFSVAVDNITFSAVPEPNPLTLAGLSLLAGIGRIAWKTRRSN